MYEEKRRKGTTEYCKKKKEKKAKNKERKKEKVSIETNFEFCERKQSGKENRGEERKEGRKESFGEIGKQGKKVWESMIKGGREVGGEKRGRLY